MINHVSPTFCCANSIHAPTVIFAGEQKLLVVFGAVAPGNIGVSRQSAYTVIGYQRDQITVIEQRAYAVVTT